MHLRCAAITLFSLQMASYFKGLNNLIEVEKRNAIIKLTGFFIKPKRSVKTEIYFPATEIISGII